MLTTVISGGQTGVDQSGLDAAITCGYMTGGWIPKGRRTEAGKLSIELFKLWRLKEHSSWAYPPRTEMNVREGDGTVLFGNMTSPGCRLTIALCKKHAKPSISNPLKPEYLADWIIEKGITTLNVAGNREETNPGIYAKTYKFMVATLKIVRQRQAAAEV